VKVGNPAAAIKAGDALSDSTTRGGQAATAMIMIYAVFWSFGLNGIPWIVSAEIFPGALRNFSGTWAALVQWLTQFIISKCLPYIFKSLGYGTWFFFASILIIATIWAFFLLPETKGLTIEQMDMILYVLNNWYIRLSLTTVIVAITNLDIVVFLTRVLPKRNWQQ
jgi:magnesium-transporting ATPase (P-type)